MEIVRNNFGLKLLAFGLALFGWAYFRFAGNPAAEGPFDEQLSIPISTLNLPSGYVARFTDHQAVVTILTKRGAPAVNPEEIKAVLDLSNKGAGIYNIPVALVAPQVVVQSLSPASVTLAIERIQQRSFPIAVHYVGAQTSTVVSDTGISPDSAVVRAPTSVLREVAAIHVDIALPNEPKTVDEMVRPVAIDSSGAELSGISIAPNLVRVQVHFVPGTTSSK